ncbi:hypothetical protein T484DRAFT_1637618 [Baffinella frigidus]|nr:hypothetical protein T484DRAFT_1637618 [Cryptophyta sp. CCMP2293]
MHGVKRSPAGEVDEAKEAAKTAKAQKLNALCLTILQRKKEKLHDQDSLALCVKALEANPEFYTAWNFRREILGKSVAAAKAKFPEGGAPLQEAVSSALAGELTLLEHAIGMNPKAYCLWVHREWVVGQMLAAGDDKVLASELALCDKLLQADERNFHCWGYRLSVARKAGRTPEEELAYTSGKIDRNFSNYSAWHYRSRFLHQAHLTPCTLHPKS